MVLMSIKYVVMLFFFILLIGCRSPDVFVPDAIINIEKSEIAIIRTDSAHEHGIFVGLDQRLYISSVNGQKTTSMLSFKSYPDASKIPLGKNIIGLYYVQMKTRLNGCVTFIAEKGRTYTAQKKVSMFKINYWVTDDTTEKIVSRPCSKKES
jgi:hypothetical protein